MNETGLGRDSFWPFIENCCADEHRSEEDLQTTEDEMCLVRCGGLLATERAGRGGGECWAASGKRERQTFFFWSNATTCPLWTSWSSLLGMAGVLPTSEVGTPMKRGYVVPMVCEW